LIYDNETQQIRSPPDINVTTDPFGSLDGLMGYQF
jgi:hypothetical protein